MSSASQNKGVGHQAARLYAAWLRRADMAREPTPLQRFGIGAGFAALLGLMVLLGALGVLYLDTSEARLERIVGEHMTKIELASRMHQTARERTVALQKMILLDDPFERDEQWMQFNNRAGEFAAVRGRLLEMVLAPEERELLDRQGRHTGEAVPLQERVVDLISQNRRAEAHRLLVEQAIPAQDAVLAQLAQFYVHQKDAANVAVKQAHGAHQNARALLIVFSLTLPGLGLVVATTVVRRAKRDDAEMRKFSGVIEQTADSVVITDREGLIEYVNPAFEKNTGFTRAEAVGRKPNLVKSGQHGAAFYERLWDTILSGAPFREVFVNRRKNDTLYYEEKTITPIKDESGTITHFVSTGKDITARMQSELETRRTQHFLDSVVENLPNMLFVKDAKDLKFVRFNKAAEELLGYARAEMIGKSDQDFFPKEEADFFTTMDREVLKTGDLMDIPREPVHTLQRGTRLLHTKKIPILDEHGQPLYLLGISEDITERVQAEDTAQRLGRILDNSTNEIYVFCADSLRFLQVNLGAQKNLDYSLDELRAMTPLDIKPDFSREGFEQLIAPLRRGEQEAISFLTNHRRKDGSLYPVEIRLQLSRNETPPVFVAIVQDITERKHAEERLSYLAYYDTLTGLPNRQLLRDRLRQTMLEADRSGRVAAVMLLDLDRFKYINDTLGHEAGDMLLKGVAERLTICVRHGDTVARLGGDEFTVVLANVAQVDDVAFVTKKILEVFTQPFIIAGRELFVSPSIGITLYPHDDRDIDNLLKNADAAMYHAKESGRNTFQFFTAELNERAVQRLELETALRHALERDEFLLHYQPLMDLKTDQLKGVEALLRWRHPQHGLVPPLDFIPLAEETGLIVPIGEWVLRTACTQAQAWHAAGFCGLHMAVNISGRQFQHQNLTALVNAVLAETGLDPQCFNLELTESVLMRNVDAAIAVMGELDAVGVGFSIDDFGTGYSSLSYLKRFPIDVLKIDRSFVRDIATDPDDAAIVTAIMALARSLDIEVVAEGVETEEQLAFLRARGCDVMQGYYFSKPVDAAALTKMLQKNQKQGTCKPRAGKHAKADPGAH